MSENYNKRILVKSGMPFYGFGRRLDVIAPNGKHVMVDLNKEKALHFSHAIYRSLVELGLYKSEMDDLEAHAYAYSVYGTKEGMALFLMDNGYVSIYLPDKMTEQAYQEFKKVVQEMEEKEHKDSTFSVGIWHNDNIYEDKLENSIRSLSAGDIEGIIEDIGVLDNKSIGSKQ